MCVVPSCFMQYGRTKRVASQMISEAIFEMKAKRCHLQLGICNGTGFGLNMRARDATSGVPGRFHTQSLAVIRLRWTSEVLQMLGTNEC